MGHEMAGVTVEDMTNLDRFQTYVKLLVDLTPTKPFSMKGIKTPTEGKQEMADWIRASTRSQYAMPPTQMNIPSQALAPTAAGRVTAQ